MTGPSSRPTGAPEPAAAPSSGIPLPLAKPIATYVLLGIIGVVFVLESLLGSSTSNATLAAFGAQVNLWVASGDYWRLLAAMFLHIGITHLFFNGWALFSLGREVEAFYGSRHFLLIYFISGLFGNMVSYVLGPPNVISAGASGAIFGLVGADIAFFLNNRKSLGRLSQQSLFNLAILVAINLVLGFTAPGINNYAHIGGLISGVALGLGMAPRYSAAWDGWAPKLINRTTVSLQILTIAAVGTFLLVGIWLGNQRWAPYLQPSRQNQPSAIQIGRPMTRLTNASTAEIQRHSFPT
jgi:rhomboid protease GluP